MAELWTLIGTLVMILVGIAVLLQIISLHEIFDSVGRSLARLVFALLLLCILKWLWFGMLVPWLSASFQFLKTAIESLLVTIACLIAVSLVGRIALRRFARSLTMRRDPQNGDCHGYKHSKNGED